MHSFAEKDLTMTFDRAECVYSKMDCKRVVVGSYQDFMLLLSSARSTRFFENDTIYGDCMDKSFQICRIFVYSLSFLDCSALKIYN